MLLIPLWALSDPTKPLTTLCLRMVSHWFVREAAPGRSAKRGDFSAPLATGGPAGALQGRQWQADERADPGSRGIAGRPPRQPQQPLRVELGLAVGDALAVPVDVGAYKDLDLFDLVIAGDDRPL